MFQRKASRIRCVSVSISILTGTSVSFSLAAASRASVGLRLKWVQAKSARDALGASGAARRTGRRAACAGPA